MNRMQYDPELIVAMVGNRPLYGSLNEFESLQLPPGTKIRFKQKDGTEGKGVIDYSWMCLDTPTIALKDGNNLSPKWDEIYQI